MTITSISNKKRTMTGGFKETRHRYNLFNLLFAFILMVALHFGICSPAGANPSWEIDYSSAPVGSQKDFRLPETHARQKRTPASWKTAMMELAQLYFRNHRVQEAIWTLEEIHETNLAAQLHRDLDKHLRTAPFRLTKHSGIEIKGKLFGEAGSPRMATFDSQIQGIYKEGTWDEYLLPNSRVEILAYKLDRVLGLNLVPLTVARQIEDNRFASLQYFVSEPELTDFNPRNNTQQYAQRKLFALWLLDVLLNNTDRSESNLIYRPGKHIVAIDHGHCRPWEMENAFSELDPRQLPHTQEVVLAKYESKLSKITPRELEIGLMPFAKKIELKYIFEKIQRILTYIKLRREALARMALLKGSRENLNTYLEEQLAKLEEVNIQIQYMSTNAMLIMGIADELTTYLRPNPVLLAIIERLPQLVENKKLTRKDFRRLLARLLGEASVDGSFTRSFLTLYHHSALLRDVWHRKRDVFVASRQKDASAVRDNYLKIEQSIHCAEPLANQH